MYKKSHKKYFKNPSINENYLKYGSYGFKVVSQIYLELEELNSIDNYLDKQLKKININPIKWNLISLNLNLTKLNIESRMGKGKGNLRSKGKFIKSGSIIYEFENLKMFQLEKLLISLKRKFKGTNLIIVSRRVFKHT